MKLIAVFAIEEYKKQLKSLFIQQKIGMYSEVDVKGFRASGHEMNADNWFGAKDTPAYSVCYFTFLGADEAEALLVSIRAFNTQHPNTNPLHAFQLGVEAAV